MWDLKKYDLALLEYMAATTLFRILGYGNDPVQPFLSGSSFGVQITWQGKTAQVLICNVGDMSVDQLQNKLHAMINDWNRFASQEDRDQVWRSSNMKRRAPEILFALASHGFPHTVYDMS